MKISTYLYIIGEKGMDFTEYYFSEENKELFLKYVSEELNVLKEDVNITSVNIPTEFVSKLLSHLESRFPDFGTLDGAMAIELRKHVLGDNSYVRSIRKRIHEIINKAKQKFLHTLSNKIEALKVEPKNKPKLSPIHTSNPLLDEPIDGVNDIDADV